ncbi:MAG: indole-3-glycerol phosphate synthase [Planctomycetaceae bacterium]|nr:MAG: indole-3-glycerol phosphate synthase [Planctomycetaceae bacterium]
MTTILESIVERKREEIASRQAQCPAIELEARLADSPPPRGFVNAIREARDVALIAEIKKASPSAGLIREDFDPVELAGTYQQAGATCLSCLTDEPFFQGRLEHLESVRKHVDRPVLRKDFLLDRYQLLEARVAGADAVLLIAECLGACELRELYFSATNWDSMCCWRFTNQRILIGRSISTRTAGHQQSDLKTFETDLGHTLRVGAGVPESTMLVAESGIRSRADVEYLAGGGVSAILVGETLMRSESVLEKTTELVGVPRR